MNSALVLLSFLARRGMQRGHFEHKEESFLIFATCGAGHFSQFFVNVPSFLYTFGLISVGAIGLQPVLRWYGIAPADLRWDGDNPQVMLYIFVLDATAAALNFACAWG
mmetsp:Transcript_95049/g.271790  ORF Transcript_95049/g.271790 Transcript_95049/m.271790 type:complete len:108 (-) Transcript_95049:290-613(-)